MTIREHWISRFSVAEGAARAKFFRTHQEWRDILSGTLFTKGGCPGVEYHLRYFWQSYPQLISDDDHDTFQAEHDYAPTVSDGTRLQPNDFCDSNPTAFMLKRLICYDVAVAHMKYQFEETDDAFLCDMKYTAIEKTHRRMRRSNLFRSGIRLPTDRPPWEHPDLPVRSIWFERFRGFLHDWPAVGSHTHPHLTVKLTGISQAAFDRAINELFIVYYSGVIKALHVVPTVLWTFPGTKGLGRYLSV